VQRNALLAALPPPELELVLSASERAALPAGTVIFADHGAPPATVYFPESGLISIRSTLSSGAQVEVAGVGRNAAFGLFATLGVGVGLPSIAAEVTLDLEAVTVSLDVFRRFFHTLPVLRATTSRSLGDVFAEVVRSAGCYRFHTHQQWLARWLLSSADKAQQETLPVTHDVIARTIGSPRHAVSASLAQLRSQELIAYERGTIRILNRPELMAVACDCYGSR
jgi:CRP-like cAMP-binding protein